MTAQQLQWTKAGYDDAIGGKVRRRAVGFRLSGFYNEGHRAGSAVRRGAKKPVVFAAYRQVQTTCKACGWAFLEEVAERVTVVGNTMVDRREVSRGPVGQSACRCVYRALGMVA